MTTPIMELTGRVRALFTDLDGTLTSDGRVEAKTSALLEKLEAAGIPIVVVTGRPAGWGQAIATLVGAAAVVTENGGVTFIREGGRLEKLYGVPAATLPEWRRRMHASAVDATADVPGARLSSDSRYREVDLAIDWNEEADLTVEDAERVGSRLREAGFAAVRSSVHVNFGPPEFDKLSACKTVVRRAFGGDPADLSPYVFVGDALNDASMFEGFPRSVGVKNVARWWDDLAAKPKFLTTFEEGAGFREVAERALTLG